MKMNDLIIDLFVKHAPDAILQPHGYRGFAEDHKIDAGIVKQMMTELGEIVRDKQIELSAAFAASIVQWERGCSPSITKKHYDHFADSLKYGE